MDDLADFPAGSSLIPLSKNTPDAVFSIHVNAHGFAALIYPLRRGRRVYKLLQYKWHMTAEEYPHVPIIG